MQIKTNKQGRQTRKAFYALLLFCGHVFWPGFWVFAILLFCFFNLPNGRKEECHQKQQDRRPSGWGKLQMQLQLRTASHLWGLQAML